MPNPDRDQLAQLASAALNTQPTAQLAQLQSQLAAAQQELAAAQAEVAQLRAQQRLHLWHRKRARSMNLRLRG